MKLYHKISSFHRLKPSMTWIGNRKFHGPPKQEEYTAVAQYPDIPQFKHKDEASYSALKNQMKSLRTVEEKQIYLNKPKYFGWYSCVLDIDKIPPDSLDLMQHATNTTIVKNKLPEKLEELEEISLKEAKRFETSCFLYSSCNFEKKNSLGKKEF